MTTKKLTWAKGAAKTAGGRTKWDATEGADVVGPEIDAAAMADRFAIKAVHDVLLWTGDHPNWATRGLATEDDKKHRSDAYNWRMDDANVNQLVAHEFGHLLGFEDEYSRGHDDMRRVTGKAPNAYMKGALKAAYQANYDKIAGLFTQVRTDPLKFAQLETSLVDVHNADPWETAVLSAHHKKLTGRRFDQELGEVKEHFAQQGAATATTTGRPRSRPRSRPRPSPRTTP